MKTKVLLSFSLVLLGTCLLVTPAQAGSPTITLAPSSSDITVGDHFTVNVLAEYLGAGDLTGFGFTVDPNAALSHISFSGYLIGSDYADVGSAFGAGPKDIIGAYNGTGNSDQNVLLATLQFSAVSVGTDTLLTRGVFDGVAMGLYYLDPNDRPVNADLQAEIRINVHDGGPNVPESGQSLPLLFVSLIALAVFGRNLRSCAA